MTFFSASMRSVCLVCAVLLSACQPEQDKKDPATPATGIVAKVEQGLQQGLGQADKGLQEARKNIDAARQKLATEDLSLNRRGAEHLPKARITPQGELLIGDQPVAITPEQKALVLAYREQLLGIIGDSMAIGMEGASVGINAAATALKAVASGGSADDVGKQAEAAAMQQIKPWSIACAAACQVFWRHSSPWRKRYPNSNLTRRRTLPTWTIARTAITSTSEAMSF